MLRIKLAKKKNNEAKKLEKSIRRQNLRKQEIKTRQGKNCFSVVNCIENVK